MQLRADIIKAGYRQKTILENIAFTAPSGSLTAVIGRNGSGKSTLLSCIAGLMPYEGTIAADNVDLASLSRRERAARVAVMQQIVRTPHIPVEDLVSFGRTPYHSVIGGGLCDEDRAAVEYALAEAETEHLRHSFADCLSGGEQKRVFFAMMLAQDAPLLLLDESTAHMDADYEKRFTEKIAALKGKKTILAVMHDLAAAVRIADQVILLDGGTMRFCGSADELLRCGLLEEVFCVKRYTARDSSGNVEVFFR
ncbi:MAG: ABC transporter ATP-binding protein [Clostridia bacterium]|nr:ABC transporter ATP-binding protein [Clostridia bacterium]